MEVILRLIGPQGDNSSGSAHMEIFLFNLWPKEELPPKQLASLARKERTGTKFK